MKDKPNAKLISKTYVFEGEMPELIPQGTGIIGLDYEDGKLEGISYGKKMVVKDGKWGGVIMRFFGVELQTKNRTYSLYNKPKQTQEEKERVANLLEKLAKENSSNKTL